MDSRKKHISLLTFLILILFIINYPYLDKTLEKNFSNKIYTNVTRIIDGDTIEVNGETSVRLLGINTPERGEEYYSEAKEFLTNRILGREVELEFGKDKYDKYNRMLAYVYLDNKNINLEIVRKGFANYYFPSGKDKYYSLFQEAWEKCIEEKINLCEGSDNICSDCIELKEFDYKNEILSFKNNCDFNCNLTSWKIKDEGRKNFEFPDLILETNKEVIIKVGDGINKENTLFWEKEEYVWTDSGDTLFLRDASGKLILFENY